MTPPLQTAEQQGRTAWRNGVETADCPYPPDQIVPRWDWMRGWVSEEHGFRLELRKNAKPYDHAKG